MSRCCDNFGHFKIYHIHSNRFAVPLSGLKSTKNQNKGQSEAIFRPLPLADGAKGGIIPA